MALIAPPHALAQQAKNAAPKQILIVNSWHNGMPWQASVEKGLRAGLRELVPGFKLFTENLDAGRFSEKSQFATFEKYLEGKYASKRVDIVISEGVPAANFLSRIPHLFPGAQRIYVQPGAHSPVAKESQGASDFSITVTQDYRSAVEETLRVANPRKIYVVADSSVGSGRKRLQSMNEALTGHDRNFETEILDNLPMTELLDTVSRLPEGSVIFFTPIFKDGTGKRFIPYQAARMIAARASVPVFTKWESLLGSGVVGGYMLSGERVGRITAKTLGAHLSGAGADLGSESAYGYYYDWRQLQRWGIGSDRLPADAGIRYYQPNFIEVFKWEIIAVFAFVVCLTAISSVLVVVNRKRKWALAALNVERAQLEVRVAERTEEISQAKSRAEAQAEELAELAVKEATLNKRLQHEIDTKDQFFSVISHDLKSPFTGLLGLTHLMTHLKDQLSREELVEYAQKAHDAGTRVFKLLEDLLEWARLQMDGSAPDPVTFYINDLAQETFGVLNSAAQEKDIALIDETGKIAAFADRGMAITVMRNLIANAVKFTESGGTVAVSSCVDGDNLCVTVSDTGVGMEPEQIENLFKIEKNVSSEGTAGEQGTGLGLPICKAMLAKNGGELWVDSAPGEGSRFHFTLPLCPKGKRAPLAAE